MDRRHTIEIARAMGEAGVRFLIVGGVAVNLHGHLRYTKDLDLVIGLEPENLKKGLRILAGLGYRPKLPVDIEDFANPQVREDWVTRRNMLVFQLWCDERRELPVDVFVTEPFDFDAAWREARRRVNEEGVEFPVLDLRRLERMKREAGRPKDLEDAEALARIRKELER